MTNGWVVGVLAVLQVAAGPQVTPAQRDLLRRADIGLLTPPSFAAQLVLTGDADGVPHPIDIWRAGDTRLLVRFAETEQPPRFLLRRGRDLWLITPSAKAPVKLPASYRLYGGVSIDEMLGVRLTADYAVAAVREGDGEPPSTVFDLRASSPTVAFPQVEYRVDPATGRPRSASYAVKGGKVATTATFDAWRTQPVLHPSRLTIRDELRKDRTTVVTISGLRAMPVPAEVFELDGHAARARLTAPPP